MDIHLQASISQMIPAMLKFDLDVAEILFDMLFLEVFTPKIFQFMLAQKWRLMVEMFNLLRSTKAYKSMISIKIDKIDGFFDSNKSILSQPTTLQRVWNTKKMWSTRNYRTIWVV